LLQLSPVQLFIYLPAIAALVYGLAWIPHLHQNPTYNFWQVHQEILAYHQRIGNGQDVHPYCSAWYTWPFLLRPVSYFYQTAVDLSEPIPITGPPLPRDAIRYVYSIYATGNPPLWWLSTTAILFILGRWCWQGWQRAVWHQPSTPPLNLGYSITSEQLWVPLYLGTNYAANFLPWAGVSRCTFLYHYMGAALFSGLALAWLVDRWRQAPQKSLQVASLTILCVSAIGFIVWSPFFFGLPLSPQLWQLRIWLSSWI
jgi:dolichyl-phosphate-mannose--protein O-mannosyl transferase